MDAIAQAPLVVDARGLGLGHAGRGIGRVIVELVRAFARTGLRATVAGPDVVKPLLGDGLAWRPMPARAFRGILSPGAFHVGERVLRLAPTASGALDENAISLCYDLLQLADLDAHYPLHRRLRYPLARAAYLSSVESLRRSRSIITISQYVRDDVVTRLGFDASRVFAVPLAAASSFRVASLDDNARDEVIWVLGGLNPNKNLDTVLRTWALGDLPRLVVVGALPSRVQLRVRALAAIARAPAPTFAGRIADGELAARMRSACCVIVPSLAEGFGLPVAEARAAGARVVASDIPVLRELADEGVEYAPPRDPHAWRDAIARARSSTSRPPPSTRRDWDDVARDIAQVLSR